MTACSFAVWAHVCWNWAVRAARTAIPLFILGHTSSTCRSLDTRRLGFIRRTFRDFGSTTRRANPRRTLRAVMMNVQVKKTVAKIVPIIASNAAFLRVIAGV
jgi:hypothetical protein